MTKPTRAEMIAWLDERYGGLRFDGTDLVYKDIRSILTAEPTEAAKIQGRDAGKVVQEIIGCYAKYAPEMGTVRSAIETIIRREGEAAFTAALQSRQQPDKDEALAVAETALFRIQQIQHDVSIGSGNATSSLRIAEEALNKIKQARG